jgi:gamma-glutamyltranspeptidase/glutathione hydrolase
MHLAPVLLSLGLSFLASSPKGAVATNHPLASEAAAEVLREGGNAVDAAVAGAFALAVVEPQSSGLGGGGFALVYLAAEHRVEFLDFREVAPAAAAPDLYERPGAPPRASLDGGLAVAVPGAVKGYAELARRLGTRPLSRLVAPAARLAETGFRVGSIYADRAQQRLACLRAEPAAAREFLVPGAAGPAPPAPGARLVRRDLARTLRLLGKDPESFYRGALARRVVAAVQAAGGVLTAEDLAAYRVKTRAPLEARYRGYRVVSAPPPSAGGAIVAGVLGALEVEDPQAGGYRPDRYLHVMIEAVKRTYARRAALLADPDQVPAARQAAEEMATPGFAEELRRSIGERATPASELLAPHEAGGTSHVSVVDAAGNAVALTTTVNYYFGSCVVVPGTGVVLNDEMDDFAARPGKPNVFGLTAGARNAPGPGKIPLSSMAPTLVFDPDGRLLLVVGAAGGARIPTAVLQVVLHVVDDGMRVDEAIAAPRLHHPLHPDVVEVEPNGLEAATAARLAARGHTLSFERVRSANVEGVMVLPSGARAAASDPRYEGVPATP